MKFDLHNHSRYSDGVLSVKELVALAKEKKLDGFALTDHDSVFGVDEAYSLGEEENILVIKGLELSTYYKEKSVHIVALFKKNEVPKSIYDFSQDIIDKRIERAKAMVKNIEEMFDVKMDKDILYKGSKIITRGNMFRCLLESNPEIDKEHASFIVSESSPAYIPASKLSTKDGLKMLKDAGAIAILAHPTLLPLELQEEVASLGFDGIEARYPLNKEHEEEKFKEIALKYNMFISAGSDFHGDIKHAMIGTSTLNEDEFKVILNKLEMEI